MKINVEFPEDRMLKNKLRFQTYYEYKYFDRPAVMFGTFARFYLEVFGSDYFEYLKDAKTQFEMQCQFQKWAIENLPDDRCQAPTITVYPDFENVHNSAAFGCEYSMHADIPPRVIDFIKTPEEADAWQPPDITEGFWKKLSDWWHVMYEMAQQTELTFNGKPAQITVAPLSIQMIGPFMVAVEMVGTDFYTWLYDYPEVCHRFLDKITSALIDTEEKFRKIDPRPRSIYGLAEDDGCNISEATFKEFSLPYDIRMYDHFGGGLVDGRSLHNCGPSNHLLDTYINDLKISTYSLFGYSCTPEITAEKLAGKCYLWGNISPMLLHDGPKEKIAEYARHYFDVVAPYGGIVFGDGANCVPGTPLEHMALCVDVAEEYAKDHPDMFTDDLEKFIADGKMNVGASGKNFVI